MAVSKFVHEARAKAAPGTVAPLIDRGLMAVLYPKDQHAYIYVLSDPFTGQVRYVGKTFDVLGRFNGHLNDKERTHKANWIRGLLGKGVQPELDVVDICSATNDAEWQAAEQRWIACFKMMGFPLTNLDSGGIQGKRLCAESKQKIKDACARRTPEQRASHSSKISLAKTGVKRPEDFKRKMSLVMKIRNALPGSKEARSLRAKNISDETRAKMRASALASSEEKRKCISETVKLRWREGKYNAKVNAAHYDNGAEKRRGQKRSSETRAKLKAAAQRRAADPAWRLAHSLALRGRKLAPESIAKREATRRAKWLASKQAT